MRKRDIPKSIEWQEPQVFDIPEQVEAQPYDYSQMPDDMPSVEDWFRIRVWQDEIEGKALTS